MNHGYEPMMNHGWSPDRVQRLVAPEPRSLLGKLVAYQHAVWRVVHVEDLPFTDDDRCIWLSRGMPDPGTWAGRPFKVTVEWVGGSSPPWVERGEDRTRGDVIVLAGGFHLWDVYRGDRWPQCSCCGEPMPCRAELQEREIGYNLRKVERFASIPPGACWGCQEPITTRQEAFTFPGDNLDLPGGQPARFHTRRSCRAAAEEYELRWLAVDPRRERVFTWPSCDGLLVVHADGTSECRSFRLFGQLRESAPDCQGHATHVHTNRQACYSAGKALAPAGGRDGEGCARGCSVDDHPGVAGLPRRPDRKILRTD